MRNKGKYLLIFSGLLLFSIVSNSQINTRSPYSRFGLGEIRLPGFTSHISMGGTGIALRLPNQINYLNPASYSSLDTLSFLFDFGLNSSLSRNYTNESSASLTNFSFDHVAISFPVTKWWKSAVGVTPFSSVGYNIKQQVQKPDISLTDYFFTGDGGLSKFFIGNSFNPVKSLSIGINLSYLFGYQGYVQIVQFPSDPFATTTAEINKLQIKGFTYNFGLQYSKTFSDKYFIILGAIYDNRVQLKGENFNTLQNNFPGGQALTTDSILINPNYLMRREVITGDVVYPAKVGAGLSFGIKEKLIISGDYSAQDWSSFSVLGRNDSLVNSNSMNLGLEYTPLGKKSGKIMYLRRIHYRLGGYYSNTYLRIRENQILDYGITFGVGLPFRNTKTSFNLGFLFGQRGTLENDLIKEKYGIVSFSMTFHDIWFFKRVID